MSTRHGPAEGCRHGPWTALLAAGLTLMFTLPVVAQTGSVLGTVRFDGNDAVSAADLARALPFRSGVGWNDSLPARGASALLAHYRTRGYYGAVIRPATSGNGAAGARVDLTFGIDEGARSTVREVVLAGCSALSPGMLLEILPIRPGDVLDVSALEEGIGRVLDAYDEAGYPLAAVSVQDITPAADGDARGLVVTLAVEEGPPVDIVEMSVEGNTETETGVILRESRITPPERYDPGKNTRFRERLQRLGIFSSVDEPILTMSEGGGGLLVRVTEGSTNTFDGVIGYVPGPPAGADAGSVVGMARIAMRNLFGTARKLEAQWSRDPGSTQEIRLSYEEPWIFGYPVNLGGRFYQRRQDTTFVERTVAGEATFLATGSLSVSAVAEEKSIIPSESAGGSAPRSSSTAGAGLVIRFDTRDERYSPRKGVTYESEYRVGTKRLRDGADREAGTVRNLSLDLDTYVGLFRNQVLNLGFHARQIWSPLPEAGDLYRLGGFRGLRGFRENRFLGSRLAWSVTEYRLLSGGRSFLYGFFDAGYIYSPLTEPPDLLTFGYGVGMRLETALGFVSVSFALGEGDAVSDTKIHFGLVNDF